MPVPSDAPTGVPASAITNILIANRGEIAVRVIHTAQALGYRTTAVYSEADRDAPHVALADDAVAIGAPPAVESYLNVERVLAAARSSGADAVHPGYGFLSENAAFARACADAGLTFIGPSARAIELMGNKAEAKRRMIAAGVPCVPGYQDRDQDDDRLVRAADEIGYPVMVKAAAGGGGRGMRLVREAARLREALALARSEAENAFGSAELILEKAIERPRHVEIQVLADAHGAVVHLGERDCSVQRRHQKVIEEAPCPVMTDELRERMGDAAVAAARGIDYLGAGTVEFLLDASGAFYFLEMNTRLQVEHPVTELVTGLDLVALQIRIAEGSRLGLTQADVRLVGHAIEARLYAEDPANDFLPSAGRVEHWRPARGEGIRVDDGVRSGQEISPHYDPMLAKLIGYGDSREAARRNLARALQASPLFGPETNRAFLLACVRHPRFAAGEATTAFLDEDLGAGGARERRLDTGELSAAAVVQYELERDRSRRRSLGVPDGLLNWSSGDSLSTDLRYAIAGEVVDLTVSPAAVDRYVVCCAGEEHRVEVCDVSGGKARLRVDGRGRELWFADAGPGRAWVSVEGSSVELRNALAAGAGDQRASSSGSVAAPMHGKVVEILVAVGDRVEEGDQLAVVEAMKMQHRVVAPIAGTVRQACDSGRQVAAGDVLVEIEPDRDEERRDR